jgi:DNA-binding response OmpR family regulator
MSLLNDRGEVAVIDVGQHSVMELPMHGLNALVVEEEYLVAADIEQILRTAGAANVTIEKDVEAARALDFSGLALAVIEAKFGSAEAVALCAALRAARVPVVVTSADAAVQALFTGATPLAKPFDTETLLAACAAARQAHAR